MSNSQVETAGLEGLKWDTDGLIPAVVQDAVSKEVLMLAYMNEESLAKSLATGQTWFWSRSRQQLWNKGATSGHTQAIRSMHYDCDGDTLLVKVEQQGAACHTGKYSCFFNPMEVQGEGAEQPGEAAAEKTSKQPGEAAANTANEANGASAGSRYLALGQLESIIAERHAERPEGSYTTYLFDKGVDKILKKVGEEAAEVIIAAKNKDNDELRSEVSDLFFHVMVLLRERGLGLDEVMGELAARYNKPTTNKMR